MTADDPAPAVRRTQPDGPATGVRYGVLAFLCALSFVLYIDRICIGQAAPSIRQELDLTESQMGIVFAAFTVAYGLFEVPVGRWGDRFGSRGVLTRIVLWWSAFTALTGAATGLGILLLVRFLFGAGEAGALPNAARVISRWFPVDRRGSAQGMVNTSALIGGAVAPVVAAYQIQLVGWRWSFVIFGGLGVIWAVAFYLWFRDHPAEHPAVNEAEWWFITSGAPPPPPGTPHPRVPWYLVLTSSNVWLLGGVITCTAFASYLYFSWFPTYLQKAREATPLQAGWLSSCVLAGGAVGCTLGGFFTDWLIRYTGNRRRSLQGIAFCTLTLAAMALWAGIHCDSAEAASLCTALASLSACVHLSAWWVAVNAISGKHLGALSGLMNSMGVPGAVASQLFVGRFVDWQKDQGYTGREQWDPAFYVYVGVLLLGACGWFFIDATRSVVEPSAKEP
jgi:sugar phosphate permease